MDDIIRNNIVHNSLNAMQGYTGIWNLLAGENKARII